MMGVTVQVVFEEKLAPHEAFVAPKKLNSSGNCSIINSKNHSFEFQKHMMTHRVQRRSREPVFHSDR